MGPTCSGQRTDAMGISSRPGGLTTYANHTQEQGRRGGTPSRLEAVARAEDYMRAHVDSQVPLSKLCRIVGLSERGLRNAFYDVRGMGPKRCLRAERLQGVRQALCDSTARSNTVTNIATEFGFKELGRFAALYRETFGVVPSETLRGSSWNRSRTPAEHERAR